MSRRTPLHHVSFLVTAAVAAATFLQSAPASAASQPFDINRLSETSYPDDMVRDVSADGDRVLIAPGIGGPSTVFDRSSRKRMALKTSGGARVISGDGSVVFGVDVAMGRVTREVVGTKKATNVSGAVPAGGWFAADVDSNDSGRFIAVEGTNGNFARQSVFLVDLDTAAIREPALLLAGGSSNQAVDPSSSGDGNRMAYRTFALAGCSNCTKAYVYDRASNSNLLVNRRSDGSASDGDVTSARISADGRHVVFVSTATNLVSGTSFPSPRVYLRDMTTGQVRLVSLQVSDTYPPAAPSINRDGSAVVFAKDASTKIAGKKIKAPQLHLWWNGSTARITTSTAGRAPNGQVSVYALSDRGNLLAFSSPATNLIRSGKDGVFFVKLPL